MREVTCCNESTTITTNTIIIKPLFLRIIYQKKIFYLAEKCKYTTVFQKINEQIVNKIHPLEIILIIKMESITLVENTEFGKKK